MSLTIMDDAVACALRAFKQAAPSSLLSHAVQRTRFIWAFDKTGQMKIAYEEIAEFSGGRPGNGHTRRFGSPLRPGEEKKLGHPTLLGFGAGRVAGELFLDEIEGRMRWVFNFSSGRYCGSFPPTDAHRTAVQRWFDHWLNEPVVFNPEY